MKKTFFSFLIPTLCLAGCAFSNKEPHYYTIDEVAQNSDDNISLTLTEMSVHGIVYPGTKDLIPLEFYLTVVNNNTSGSIYFSLRNYEWILIVGEYKYACDEMNGTTTIEAGGKGVLRPWFYVPENVYKNNNDIKLKMNRPYHSLFDNVKYEIWWKIEKPQ
jgi:hypothetical protein